MNRDELNAHLGQRVGGEPEDEAEHFITCPKCGQAIDCRRLGDVLHHDDPDHEPIPNN